MFIPFVMLLIAFIFQCLCSAEMRSHSHWLFVGSTVVWYVHFAPDKVKSVFF